jgi:8-oxo-dGTP pyrophosphatase MutT (NUDIX family)
MKLGAKRGPATVSVALWERENLLLVRRGPGGLFPFTWTLPGGELLANETTDAAARRVAREFGIEATETRIVRQLPQPSPLRDDRGPDVIVELVRRQRPVSSKPPRYTGVGYFARGDLGGQRMFREARQAILALWSEREARKGAPA